MARGDATARSTRRVVIGTVADFPVGKSCSVEVDGRAVAVFNIDGRFYALRDVCPHQGAPLSRGPMVGSLSATEPGCYRYDSSQKRVRCPWHGWEYDLATGQSSFDPKRNRVRSFPVTVEEGAALSVEDHGERMPGPYVAETFSISVDDDYVVIEV